MMRLVKLVVIDVMHEITKLKFIFTTDFAYFFIYNKNDSRHDKSTNCIESTSFVQCVSSLGLRKGSSHF